MGTRKFSSLLIGVLAFLLALYPHLFSLYVGRMGGCFSWLAADAFYYLTVAKQVSWSPLFSYDGMYATNGFHPLWQAFLKAWFASAPFLGESLKLQILFAFGTGALCTAVAGGLIARYIFRLTGNAALSLLGAVPGLLYFVWGLADLNFGSFWSFNNGMESPFSLLLFAILIVFLARCRIYSAPSVRGCVVAALLVSLLILARLDDVFLAPALALPFLRRGLPLRRIALCAGILVGIPFLVVFAYCAFNLFYAGMALPVSGQTKAGFILIPNLLRLLAAVVPLHEFPGGNWDWWNHLTWRALFNCVPAIFALAFLLGAARRSRGRRRLGHNTAILCGLSVYVILKSAYNVALVGSWHQGHWYFPLTICTANILLAVWLGRMIRPEYRRLRLAVPRWGILAGAICTGLAGLAALTLAAIGHVPTTAVAEYLGPFRGASKLLILGGAALALCALLLATWLADYWSKHPQPGARRGSPVRFPADMLVSALVILFAANAIMAEKAQSQYNQHYARFFRQRDAVSLQIKRACGATGLLSFDDGVTAYSLNLPAMAGLGFNLDVEALKAQRSGRLLDLAFERGFRCLTSIDYMPHFTARKGDDVTAYLRSAFWLAGEDVDRWVFRVAYVEPETGCRFIEFFPADDASPGKAKP